MTAIESFGDMVSKRMLCDALLGAEKHPGILSNKMTLDGAEQDFQLPHWDCCGWRGVKAEEMALDCACAPLQGGHDATCMAYPA